MADVSPSPEPAESDDLGQEIFTRIEAARRRLDGHAHRTPVVTSRTLDRRVGAEVFLKCENLQRVGAFKFRGAYNAISQLGEEEKKTGVLAYSSGNHAQAVALVGRLLGIETTIVMPSNAPAPKRAATEGYGARVVEYDVDETTRREVADKLLAERPYALIPPFDHPEIVAGQGTSACELLEQAGPLDMLIVPVGGGGLLAGCSVATKHIQPDCTVVGIEPQAGDDAVRSFHSGVLQTVRNPDTIADGTRTPSLGELNFKLIRRYADDIQAVSEDAIKDAVRFLLTRTKMVVEPSGALGVAALLSGTIQPGARTGVVLSGGNIDPKVLIEILAR